MYKIGSMPKSIPIGYTGETNFRSIEIDMTAWLDKMPAGVPSIVHIRPGESKDEAYIAVTDFDRETGILSWTITAADVGTLEGEGEMQVWLEETENDTVNKRGKSVKVITKVIEAANSPDSNPPSGQEAFLEQINSLKNQTVAAAEEAEDAQDAAETAQAAAEQAAQDAENVNLHPAYIDSTTKHWMVYDAANHQYTDTQIKAVGEDGQDGQDGQDATPDLICLPYEDLTFPVSKGTLCYHGSDLCKAKQDISTSEDWTAAHWDATNIDTELRLQKNAIDGVEDEFDAKTSDIISLIGQSTIKNKKITGNSTYQAVIKMDLYANTLYSMNLKLKSASSVAVYYKMVKSDGTTIGYSDSLSAGNTYAYKAVTPSEDCLNAEFQVSSSADFVIEYANIFSQDGLMQKIGKAIIGDDITMLSVTSSNKKSISGAGTINTETDSTMYVTDDIEIKQGHWYMVTASAGYSAAYYAILDADKNVMMVERAPSGSGTVIINKMVYMPSGSKYIRIAYVSSISGGLIAICNTIKTRKYEAPEWWNKFLAISYSDIGVAHTNSLETFVSAGHFGFPVCKGDVRPTSDNKLIMCHDGGFTFDGNGRITVYNSSDRTLIHNITHDTAMEYEYAGQESATENNHYQKVCDIDDYLQTCKQYGMIAFITAREDYISTVCTELINALKRNNMLDRAIINSYTAQTLSYIRMLDDNLPLSFVQSDNYNLGTARVNVARGYRNMAITLVSTEANMRTYLTGLASVIADANSKGVGIMYAQPRTLEDVEWLRKHGIMGAQIGRPCLPYRFEQIKFKVDISSGVATLSEWFGMTTMEADVSQSGNVISISEFKVAGSGRSFSDLIMEYWMNRFPYRITAVSENGNTVTAAWQNNALKLTVSNINTDDVIKVIVEV